MIHFIANSPQQSVMVSEMEQTTEPVESENAVDSENLGAAVVTRYGDAEDMGGARSEDPEEVFTIYEESEVISSKKKKDIGYLNRSDSIFNSEDATILVGPLNLSGQNLIVTQNEDGNKIIVLVPSDADGEPLNPNFVQTILQQKVTSEEALKGHDTLVVGEHSQGIEFIKPAEESEEHKERHVYFENSDELLNISNENVGSAVGIESPIWSVPNGAPLKNDGTEMVFIPYPTIVLVPDKMKHRNLMQLACIAHELQSADQKSSSAVICDYSKDPESSTSVVRTPLVEAIQSTEEKNLDNDDVAENPLSPERPPALPSPLQDNDKNQTDEDLKERHSNASHRIQESPMDETKLDDKNRFPVTEQGLRSFSLRSCSLSTLPLKCGDSEISDSDVSKSPFDPSNSDNIPRGKVLLETSLDECSEPVNDVSTPSTPFALPKFPKETSTPLLSPEQQRRKSNRYKRDFERLLKPPYELRHPRVGGKKYSHPNVIRATKSHYSKSNSLPLTIKSSPTKRQREKHLATLAAREIGSSNSAANQRQKLAKIIYLDEKPIPDHSQRVLKRFTYKDLYSCTSCNFHSIYADNLMEHLKYCSSKSPSFHYEVNNMDKRQRIREKDEIVNTVNNALKKIR